MGFFSLISVPGFGQKQDSIKENPNYYGEARISAYANITNGNLFVKDFHKVFVDQGFQIEIGQIYNSQSNEWRINHGKKIQSIAGKYNEPGSIVSLIEADGHESHYVYDKNRHCYVNQSEEGSSTLTYTSTEEWVGWNPLTQLTEYYHGSKLQKICNNAGNILQYSYDQNDRLSNIIGSTNSIQIEYNDQKIKIFLIEAEKKNLWLTYDFDQINRLVKTTVPFDNNSTVNNYVIDYQYQSATNCLQTITQSDQTKLSFDYLKGKNNKDFLKEIINGIGEKYIFEYAEDSTKVIDALGATRIFTLNPAGLLARISYFDQHEDIFYDKLHRIQTIIYSDDTSEIFSYDELGCIETYIDRNQAITKFYRDPANGLLLSKTKLLKTESAEKLITEFYVYDDKKQLIYQVLPNGAVTAYSYDEKGNCTQQKTYRESWFDLSPFAKEKAIAASIIQAWENQQNPSSITLTEWTYNERGQKKSESVYANIADNGAGIVDEQMSYHEYEWYSCGKLMRHKKRLDKDQIAEESYHYDGLSRVSRNTNWLGEVTDTVYKDNQQHMNFKEKGLCITTFKDAGAHTIQIIEEADNIKRITKHNYDARGRLCIITHPNDERSYLTYDQYSRQHLEIDRAGRVTENLYDINNYLVKKSRYEMPLANIDEVALLAGKWSPTLSSHASVEIRQYDAEGNLRYTIDEEQYITENRYDSLGNLIEKITYANRLAIKDQISSLLPSDEDRHHQFFYDAANFLIAEKHASGTSVVYERNAKGQLKTKLTFSELEVSKDTLLENIEKENALTIEKFILDAKGLCLTFIDAENIATHYSWDAFNRKIKSERGELSHFYRYDAKDRMIEETFNSGLMINKTYNSFDDVLSESQTDLFVPESETRKRHYRYNRFGEITHELNARVSQKLNTLSQDAQELLWQNQSIQHVYSDDGLRISTSDELGQTTYFYYNAARELCFTINPKGFITEYTYDSLSLKTKTVRYYALPLTSSERLDLTGGKINDEWLKHIQSYRSEKDESERYEYNDRDLLKTKIDGEGYSTRYEYNAFQQNDKTITQITANTFRIDKTIYDKKDRPLKKIKDCENLAVTENWQYDDQNKLTLYTDANGNQNKTYYDKLDRIHKEINSLGFEKQLMWDDLSRPKFIIDEAGNKREFLYENHGRCVIQMTPLQRSHRFEKNAFAEVIIEQDAEGNTKKKTYDVDGQVKTETDSNGNVYTYFYNDAGLKTRIIDPLNVETTYLYDECGQIERQIEDAQGLRRQTTFAYDMRGREISCIDGNQYKTIKRYDKRGAEIECTIDPDGLHISTLRSYDGLNHVICEIKRDQQNQFITAFAYDALGRNTKKIIDPDQLKLTAELIYDSHGNITASIDDKNHLTRFVYDIQHRLRYVIDPMGGVKSNVYDVRGLCIEERLFFTRLDLKNKKDYSLNEIEKCIKIHELDSITRHHFDEEEKEIASLNSKGKLTTYQYNGNGQKISEYQYATPIALSDFPDQLPATSIKDRKLIWIYDQNGNERFFIDPKGAVQEKVWNEKNWLIEEINYAHLHLDKEKIPAPVRSLDDRITNYVYDQLGRIILMIDGEGYVIEHAYDAGEKPRCSWFYPDRINIPTELTLSSIRKLLPDKQSVPCVTVEYDALNRKVSSQDELKHKEEFKLDALGNLREYINKNKNSWVFNYDSAGRKIEELTPPVLIESVNAAGKLIQSPNKERVTKKIDYRGDNEIITEGFGREDARTIEIRKNACGQIESTKQDNVKIDDEKIIPTLNHTSSSHEFMDIAKDEEDDDFVIVDPTTQSKVLVEIVDETRPEVNVKVSTAILYNAQQKPIVECNEAGSYLFKVYDKALQLVYEIDQEGYVTLYEYDVFGNITKLTRYAEKINLNLAEFYQVGLLPHEVKPHIVLNEKDRTLYFSYDEVNNQIETRQAANIVYIPRATEMQAEACKLHFQEEYPAKYGEASPTTIKEYNSFGEVHSEKKLIDPFANQWEVKKRWFDKRGFVLAELDSLQYLSTYQLDKNGNQTEIIEYAKPLDLNINTNLSLLEVFNSILVDKNDRHFICEYDARGDLIKKIEKDIEIEDISYRNNIPYLIDAVKKDLITFYTRDPQGLVISETRPDGEITITQYDERDLPILKTDVRRQLEKGVVTPVITLSHNAFAEITRVTKHANPYEQNAYRNRHEEDQISLTGYDNRGLPVMFIDAEGAVKSQSFSLTKKLARTWQWVTGFENAMMDKKIKRLHQSIFIYDNRGFETFKEEKVFHKEDKAFHQEGGSIKTARVFNAFGEKEKEGPGNGTYPLYWFYNNAGEVQNTNEDSGVPTITLYDARHAKTLILRSRVHSLSDIDKNKDLIPLLALNDKEVQRTELILDKKGNIREQHLPAFTSLKPNAPEPYPQNIAIYAGHLYQQFGFYSLSWMAPEIKALEANEIKLWPKGDTQNQIKKPIIINNDRWGVDVSDLPMDEYDYQLDLYYRDPLTHQREGNPRYRVEGDVAVMTYIQKPTNNNIIWSLVDDVELIIAGNVSNIIGIELLKNGVPHKRVPAESSKIGNCIKIDLNDQPSGKYDFRLLYGSPLVVAKNLQVGVNTDNRCRIDWIQTKLSQKSNFTPINRQFDVMTEWHNLPPYINRLKHEVTVSKSYSNSGNPFQTSYPVETKVEYLQSVNSTSTLSFFSDLNHHVLHEIPFSSNVVQNRLDALDEAGHSWPIGEVMPMTPTNSSPPYLYIRSHLPIDSIRDSVSGRIFKLENWANHTYRLMNPPPLNECHQYDLISITTDTCYADEKIMGNITLHTWNMASKELIARELSLNNINLSASQLLPFTRQWPSAKDVINLDWHTTNKIDNLLKLNCTFISEQKAGQTYTFNYQVGRGSNFPFNGHVLPHHIFFKGKIHNLSLQGRIGADWIPLSNSYFPSYQQLPDGYQHWIFKNAPCSVLINHAEEKFNWIAMRYLATLPDSYTLWFYPLPETVASVQIEYCDTTLPQSVWRNMPNGSLTGHGYAIPINNMELGHFQFRLKAFNRNNASVDLSHLAKVENGWAYGEFTIKRGATLNKVSYSKSGEEIVRPCHLKTVDRWGNVLTSITPMGDETQFNYTKRNQIQSQINPTITITKENGEEARINPNTHYAYDINGFTIGFRDANNHVTVHQRDKDGTVLKTTRADGVYKEFILDMFGRSIKIRDPLKNEIKNKYDRCGREILNVDGCQWSTEFTYNELGNRLSIKNGNGEINRFDYLSPLNQVTHHYLPHGELLVKNYERNGQIVLEQQTNNVMHNTWQYDYFGNINTHVDRGSAVYSYERNPNYPVEVTRIKSEGGDHGLRINNDGSTKPMDPQDIIYLYDEASQLVAIIDNALPLTTRFRYNLNGHRARETFMASDGHIHQAVNMQSNALGWLEKVSDTVMQVDFGYDAKGNRRFTIASAYWDNAWQSACENNWYAYTDADNMRISKGKLQNGIIDIAPNKGTKLLYDLAGRREYEITQDKRGKEVEKRLYYLGNNLLDYFETKYRDKFIQHTKKTHFTYDGKVARRHQFKSKTFKQKTIYNQNAWVTAELSHDEENKLNTHINYELNQEGLPIHQISKVRTFDHKDGYDDDLTTKYVGFDVDKIAETSGTRHRVSGETTSHLALQVSYDPNGREEFVTGAVVGGERYFITNSEGRIVEKSIQGNRKEYYFYTANQEPLGRFGNIPHNSSRLMAIPSDVDFDLNYHAVSEHFPPPSPSHYVVQLGDTFADISEKVYGDASFANLIANANGYGLQDNPSIGMTLEIPNVVNTNVHNWQGLYASYNPASIIGNLSVNLPTPKRFPVKPKNNHAELWKLIVEVAVGVATMAIAPHLAAFLSKTMLEEIFGTALGWGLAGAASSIAQQETAIILSDQKNISWTQVGESALLAIETAGVAKVFGINLQVMPDKFTEILEDGIKMTLGMQALTFATGQQKHFDWRVTAEALTNTIVNATAHYYFGKSLSPTFATFASDTTQIGVAAGVNAAFVNSAESAEQAAAVALGTVLGNQVAEQSKKYYAEYQSAREDENLAKEKLIQGVIELRKEQGPIIDNKGVKKNHSANGSTASKSLISTNNESLSSKSITNNKSISSKRSGQNNSNQFMFTPIKLDDPKLPLPGRRYGKMSYELSEMNRARLERWQQESSDRRTWATRSNQMRSTNNAVDELLIAANKVDGGSTSWIENKLASASAIELAVMIGIGAAVAPEVLLSATDYIGSAFALGGPTAEVAVLSGTLGDAAILQATRWGGSVAAATGGEILDAGKKLLNTGGKMLDAGGQMLNAGGKMLKRTGLFGRGPNVGNEGIILSSGGRQLNNVRMTLKTDEEAAKFYEMVRNESSNMDVNLISKNTGMPAFQVQRIKQHLFFDKHQLASGIERFSPDIEIADAWVRLQRGSFVKQDINLLQHEYFEARFKGIFKTDYITAHNAANASLRIWNPDEFVSTLDMSWRP